jgi:rhodanese-related sulfurtransferase
MDPRLVQYIEVNHWLVAVTVLVLVLVIVFEFRARTEGFAALSPHDAIRLMNHGALVIDLRPAEQYAAGHLSGARRMDGEQILKAAETLKKYLQKPLIVYDESGSLGGSAARRLKAQGFTQAFNLRGGLAAWRSDNLPLEKGSKAGA